MQVLSWMVIGAIVGHAVRRAVPALLGLRDRSLPFTWPWVEGAGVLLVAGMASVAPDRMIQVGILSALLLAVIATDVHSKLIPDRLTYPGTILGIALNAWLPHPILTTLSQDQFLRTIRLGGLGERFGDTMGDHVAGAALAVLGALLGFVVLEGFRRFVTLVANVEGMGMGDAKLLMLIGAFLGPHAAVLTLLPACAFGAAFGVVHKLRTGLPHAPFGPALAVGALLVAHGGETILAGMWRVSLAVFSLPTGATAAIYGALIALLAILMWRLRQRAAYYEEMLEQDYREIEAGLEGTDDDPHPDR